MKAGWGERPAHGYGYGARYIKPFIDDIDKMFMNRVEDKLNKTIPPNNLEKLQIMYPSRLDLPSEAEIGYQISSLIVKNNRSGSITRTGMNEIYIKCSFINLLPITITLINQFLSMIK